MTVLEHLDELRKRLIMVGFFTLVGVVIAIPLVGRIIDLLIRPAGVDMYALRPTETFSVYMSVVLVTGAALAMPGIVYEALRFVLPALHTAERRYVFMAVPAVSVAFFLGLAFGWAVVIPAAVRFLLGFGGESIRPLWSVQEYLSFVSTFLFWVGLSFETPIVVFFLAKLGVVNVQQLTRFRKFALVGAFLVAAMITPTPDPLNQSLVALPIYLLYELGILLARLA
jgi:sec-independent protein translocase protein TatC